MPVIPYNRTERVDLGPAPVLDNTPAQRGEEAVAEAYQRAGSVLTDIGSREMAWQGKVAGERNHKADQQTLIEFNAKHQALANDFLINGKDRYKGESAIHWATDYQEAAKKLNAEYEKRALSGDGQLWMAEAGQRAVSSATTSIQRAAGAEWEQWKSNMHTIAQTEMQKHASADPAITGALAENAAYTADVHSAEMNMPPEERKAFQESNVGPVVKAGIDSALSQQNTQLADELFIKYGKSLPPETQSAYRQRLQHRKQEDKIAGAAEEIAKLPTYSEREAALQASDLQPEERRDVRNQVATLINQREVAEIAESQPLLEESASIDVLYAGDEMNPEYLARKADIIARLPAKAQALEAVRMRRVAYAKVAADKITAKKNIEGKANLDVETLLAGQPVEIAGVRYDYAALVRNPDATLAALTSGMDGDDRSKLIIRAKESMAGKRDKVYDMATEAVMEMRASEGVISGNTKEKQKQAFIQDVDGWRLQNKVYRLATQMKASAKTSETDIRAYLNIAKAEAAADEPYAAMTAEARTQADEIYAGLGSPPEDAKKVLRYRMWLAYYAPQVAAMQPWSGAQQGTIDEQKQRKSGFYTGLMVEPTPAEKAKDNALLRAQIGETSGQSFAEVLMRAGESAAVSMDLPPAQLSPAEKKRRGLPDYVDLNPYTAESQQYMADQFDALMQQYADDYNWNTQTPAVERAMQKGEPFAITLPTGATEYRSTKRGYVDMNPYAESTQHRAPPQPVVDTTASDL